MQKITLTSWLITLTLGIIIVLPGCAARPPTKPGDDNAYRPVMHEFINGDRCYTWGVNAMSCLPK